MAYRKTEKVLAQLEARRQLIIASAIDIITKSGIETLTTDAIATRANVANGAIYQYFPDKAELNAAVFAHLLARDLAVIREAAQGNPLDALASAVTVFFARLDAPRLARACGECPLYCTGIRDELSRLIRTAVDLEPSDARLAAGATLGALYGLVDTHGRPAKRASTALLFVLRGIGVSDALARKAVSRYSLV